ncbi:hypothetical protein ACHAWF_003320 [Thalassiosira exigua]
MIESAKLELDKHKAQRTKKIESMKTGYSDNPSARARRLAELEARGVNYDPEYLKKEKALKDALEYLEEMRREELAKATDLLDDDEGRGRGGGGGGGSDLLDGVVMGEEAAFGAGGAGDGGADLLGFDDRPPPPAPDLPTDAFFGGTSAATSNGAIDGAGDLLGFDPFSGGIGGDDGGGLAVLAGTRPASLGSTTAGMADARQASYGMGRGGNDAVAIADFPGAGAANGFEMRPSLVTGTMGTGGPRESNNEPGFAGGGDAAVGPTRTERDEAAEEERARKMTLAAGLFAGVGSSAASGETSARKPTTRSGDGRGASASDELIPVSNVAPPAATTPASFGSAFDVPADDSGPSSADPFAMGPMGGVGGAGCAPRPSAETTPSLPVGPMGGAGFPLMPPTAPPPPPTDPPPPPPPAPPGPGELCAEGGTTSMEQMQETIRQQQAQMQQMMQMMQQMQMQGGTGGGVGGGGMGGWPPPS